MSALKYLEKQPPVMLAVAGVIVFSVLYFAARQTVKDVAQGAAGLITGDNAITRNQTNAAGEVTNAYESRGIFGTLGGAANSASGGILASAGEGLGGWIFDVFGPKPPKL